ncbi:MAG: fimbrillin family protein [Rikenellaceae bacterium]
MKKISLFIAACTLCAAVGCSQDEGTDLTASSSENIIGFMTNTTRAETLTLTHLQEDDAGFAVYGIKNGNGSWDGQMDGSNFYSYVTGDWDWTGSKPAWPSESTDYPINFYAFYPTTASGMSVDDNSESQLAITYQAPTDGQSDILVASATTDERPVGDKLPLTFNHILSKVNLNVVTDETYVVYTQALGLNQICNERQYKVATGAWESQAASDNDNFPYMLTQDPAVDSSSDDIVASYGDLMLLPQTTDSWDPESSSESVEGAHLYVIYRAEDVKGADLIGYEDASSHPDYNPDTDSAIADMALFVMVGYPLGETDFTYESGKGYTYNINIGVENATNGYLIDDYYYDEGGNKTKFEVEGKDIGDAISDGYINFTVTVNSWEDTTSAVY